MLYKIMQIIKMKSQVVIVIFLIGMCAKNVYAARVNYLLSASVAHDTNVNLESENETGESAFVGTGNIAITENTANFVSNLNASVTMTEYAKDVADDDVESQLVGDALWVIDPKRFEWFLADAYTQTLNDPLERNTLNNRTYANAFSTGPNYYIRINQTNNVALELRYNNFSYDNDDSNNVTLNGAARWLYNLSRHTIVGINYEEKQINYDNDVLNTDLTRKDTFGNFTYNYGFNSFELSAGTTELDNDFDPPIKENVGRISVHSQRTRSSAIRFGAERSLSDSASALLELLDDPLATDPVILNRPDQYLSDRAYASYIYNSSKLAAQFTVYEEKSRYFNDLTLNDDVRGVNFTSVLEYDPVGSFIFDARFNERLYPDLPTKRTDKDSTYALQYIRNARKNIDVGIMLASERRKSTEQTNEYKNSKIMFSIVYRTSPALYRAGIRQLGTSNRENR